METMAHAPALEGVGIDQFLQENRSKIYPAVPHATQPNEVNGSPEPLAASDAQAKAGTKDAETTGKTEKAEKSPEQLKKELSLQAKANLRLGKERMELKQQLDAQKRELAELKAKVDGTHIEPSEEQKQRDAEIRAEFEKYERRRDDSKELAIEEFGEEFVLQNIYQEESPINKIQKDQPWMVQRIMLADQPVVEAVRIVQEQEVLTKFGRDVDSVLKKVAEILRPKLFEEFTKELQSKRSEPATVTPTPNLTQARSSGSGMRHEHGSNVKFSALNLNPHNSV